MIHNSEFMALVADAQTRVKEITVAELQLKLQAETHFKLIDVREESEWQMGRLNHAIHISKGVIERDLPKWIEDKEQEIILYCGGGYRSALAADAVQKMGYCNVWSLQGGFRSWVEAGFPVLI